MLETGTLVMGRPWIDGREQEPTSGVVVDLDPDLTEFAGVWFYTLGELDSADEGRAIQAIYRHKLTETGHVRNAQDDFRDALRRRVALHKHSRSDAVTRVLAEAISLDGATS